MAAIAYVNGSYRPLREAAVNVEDRGYQFGDGIYEVLYVFRGRLIDADLHFARLERSLAAIEMAPPVAATALGVIISEVIRRNRIRTALVYLQVTRGVAARNHPFPAPHIRSSLVVTARPKPEPPADIAAWTGNAITLPDERWGRCDIKSINLLPNVLAREAAKREGAYEAILFDNAGNVTEGAASSVWVVTADGALLTRQLDAHILPGCTRAALLEELASRQVRVAEAAVSVADLRAAREIFLTSATSFVKPIVTLDGVPVGDGQAGPVARGLYALYLTRMQSES